MSAANLMKAMFCIALVVVLGGWACNPSAYHRANLGAKQVANALAEFETQIEAQYAAGTLDKDEAKSLAHLASDATLANDVFIARVRALNAVDKNNAALLAGWFSDLAGDIDKLDAAGVTHIKNPTAQAEMRLRLEAIRAGLATLQLLIEGLTAPAPAPPPVQQAGMDAEAILLALAAFNSLAKLLLQARADGSLSDEQLQQAALEENADTRNHAAAFIANLEAGGK